MGPRASLFAAALLLGASAARAEPPDFSKVFEAARGLIGSARRKAAPAQPAANFPAVRPAPVDAGLSERVESHLYDIGDDLTVDGKPSRCVIEPRLPGQEGAFLHACLEVSDLRAAGREGFADLKVHHRMGDVSLILERWTRKSGDLFQVQAATYRVSATALLKEASVVTFETKEGDDSPKPATFLVRDPADAGVQADFKKAAERAEKLRHSGPPV
jgi:hypothetical protein